MAPLATSLFHFFFIIIFFYYYKVIQESDLHPQMIAFNRVNTLRNLKEQPPVNLSSKMHQMDPHLAQFKAKI